MHEHSAAVRDRETRRNGIVSLRTSPGSESPHDIAAERNVIGAMLLHATAVTDVAAILQGTDFYLVRHQLIYRALRACHASHGNTDPLSVAAELTRTGALAEAGGREQLFDLVEGVVTAEGVEHHAEIVRDHARRRRLIDTARDLQRRVGEGEDLAELAASFEHELRRLAGSRPRQTQLRTLAEIEAMPPQRWLVRHLLPAPGVGFLVGPPNVGKTAIAFDLAMRVFHGRDFFGRPVLPGSVLYVVGEGVAGIGARSAAWRGSHACEVPAGRFFEIATGLPALSSPAGLAELRATIDDLVTRHGHAPALVCIDTLSAHWTESEDKSEFAAPAMAALQRLGSDHGAAVMLLHHERKPSREASGGALAALRGSGAWAGSADFVLTVGGEPNAIEIGTAKQRDAERGAPLHCRLVRVDLGVGEDGEPRSSIVLAPAEGPASQVDVEGEARAADDQAVARLRDAVRRLAGTPTTRDAVVEAAKLRLVRGRTLLDLEVGAGRIVAVPQGRRTIYSLAPVLAGGAHTTPQTPRDGGTAASPHHRTVPDGDGTAADGGTASVDDGRPEQPGARRARPTEGHR